MSTSYGWEGKGRYGSFRFGWTCGCASKIVKSLENTCHTWALLRWWFTTKRRYIKCMHLYLLPLPNLQLVAINKKIVIFEAILMHYFSFNVVWYATRSGLGAVQYNKVKMSSLFNTERLRRVCESWDRINVRKTIMMTLNGVRVLVLMRH